MPMKLSPSSFGEKRYRVFCFVLPKEVCPAMVTTIGNKHAYSVGESDFGEPLSLIKMYS